ncbi:MAG: hypothetical protein WCC60_21175 [Ilumatobacteraceae bacterium]
MTTPSDDSALQQESPRSRRTLLRLAGAAAAGTTVAVIGSAGNAAAVGALVTDSTTNAATTATGLTVIATAVPYGLGVTDNGIGVLPSAVSQSAVLGHAADAAFRYGVVGYLATTSETTNGAGVKGYASGFGHGVVGVAANYAGVTGHSDGTLSGSAGVIGTGLTGVHGSGRAIGVSAYSEEPGGVAIFAGGKCGAIRFATWTGTPTARTEAHEANILDNDDDHNLWWSYEGGTPGKWRKIAGPGTAGAFHPITPTRVYDSRQAAPTPGVLAAGSTRTVSVKDGRNVSGGAVTVANLVPAGATAIACNLGITATTGGGYLSVNPGGNTTVTASTINWSADGQTLANGIIATINPATREVTVICGPGGSTHFFLDVTGYWR